MNNKYNNIVLILGNGFDIELRQPTQYSDFLQFTYFAYCMLNGDLEKALNYVEKHIKQETPVGQFVNTYLEKIFPDFDSIDVSYIRINIDEEKKA